MAAWVTLLLGVLLVTHRPGDSGEGPRAPTRGDGGCRGRALRFSEVASRCRLRGLKVLLQAGPSRWDWGGGEMHCPEWVLGLAAGFGAMREPWPCAPLALLEANGNLSCRCAKTTRGFISPRKYSSVEVWPVGSSCRRLEVV